MSASYRLGAGALLGLVICLAALVRSEYLTAVLAVALIGTMSWAWLGRVEIPARRSSFLVILVIGIIAALIQLFVEVDRVAHWLTLTGALGVLLAFLTQMLRTTRERITESIASTVTGLVIALFLPGWVLAMRFPNIAIACAAALMVSLIVVALPIYSWARLLNCAVTSGLVAFFVPMWHRPGSESLGIAAMGCAIGITVYCSNQVLGNMTTAALPLPSGASSPQVIEQLKARQPKPMTFTEALSLTSAQAGIASVVVFVIAYTMS